MLHIACPGIEVPDSFGYSRITFQQNVIIEHLQGYPNTIRMSFQMYL